MSSEYPKLTQAFAEEPDRFPRNLAARHPRIAGKLDSLWGSSQCIAVLDELMLSGRPDRHGFSFEVACELFSLKESHDGLYPQLGASSHDPFSAAISDAVRAGAERRRELARQNGNGATGDQPAVAGAPNGKPQKSAEEKRARAASAGDQARARIREDVQWPQVSSLEELGQIMEQRGQGLPAPRRDARQLLEILQQYVVLSSADIDNAIKIQSLKGKKREPIGKVLLQLGVVSSEYVTRALCLQYGVLMANLQRMHIHSDAIKQISIDVARRANVAPLAVLDGVLFLAVENPFAFDQREYFGFLAKSKIELVMAPAEQIVQCLAGYGQINSVKQADQEFRFLAQKALADAPPLVAVSEEQDAGEGSHISQNDATVVGLVNKIISDASAVGASDIHIESFPSDPLARIRFRRDGRMESYSQYAASYHRAVVSRIKIMASLNIAERRLAQDGKITVNRAGHAPLDLRVATIPTVRSIENVTIRLLHAGDPLPIDRLRMVERDLAVFKRLIEKPYGLILVCGPTGSGKTSTLHSVLQELNTPERKIWTAEDPIEIVQKNLNQVQVNAKIGWTFATALRAFLRADPDVIMIGEMRDLETAQIALEASMTGHLVLSTLHTNSASETTARLLDLEVDPFNLADALICVLAQRLTRGLCPHCAQEDVLSSIETDELAVEYYFSAHQRPPSLAEKEAIVRDWRARLTEDGALTLRRPKGCAKCSGEGYKGRFALFELLEVTPQIRDLIAHKSSAAKYHRIAVSQGMRTLKQDGIEKALQGLTDMTQVRGVCN